MKHVEITHIRAGKSTETKMVEANLETYQSLVGGYIEVVPVGNENLMVVNEEGLIHRLPHNQKASTLSGRNIVGDVFLIAQKDFE